MDSVISDTTFPTPGQATKVAFGFFATMSLLLLVLIRQTLAETKGQSLETLERGWQAE